ncbi:hypothetical protein A0127_08000 [Thermococcus peptonophilus]|uniref:Uncharacterized protein n=1 Tax=Thermococcus peptonophilus TaxID=53952 RepID=A0A142CWG0_9EURY|nr:hypothetical protein A0127_08000 [Thermococcus peptonophilus]
MSVFKLPTFSKSFLARFDQGLGFFLKLLYYEDFQDTQASISEFPKFQPAEKEFSHFDALWASIKKQTHKERAN